jgi:hypothetical protein
MPPVERFVCRFAAEPPQESLPHGEWAQTLQAEFLAACLRVDADAEAVGEARELQWFPDRSWNGRTYVPVTARTTTGGELFGYVSYVQGEHEPEDFRSTADFTEETADRNPDWKIDISEEVIGTWRGEGGRSAEMTLVWGIPLIGNGDLETARELDFPLDAIGRMLDQPVLDASQLQVRLNGRQIRLSQLEFGVLSALAGHAGRALSRADLIQQVWGTSYTGGSNVVDAVVRTLRRKLGQHASLVETVRGVGYRYTGL